MTATKKVKTVILSLAVSMVNIRYLTEEDMDIST